MNTQQKAREFWITWKSGYKKQATVDTEKPKQFKESTVHVIDYSALETTIKDLDYWKQSSFAEYDKRKALEEEIKRLREALGIALIHIKHPDQYEHSEVVKAIDKALSGETKGE